MRENDEVYADSGAPVEKVGGVSRGTALKVGGLGLAGALAAFLPGRAAASAKRVAANSICQGTASFCLADEQNIVKCGFGCACLKIYYGRAVPLHGPVGACASECFDPDGDTYGYCGTPGQKDCPGKCYPSLCPGPNCPEACDDKPCWGPAHCPPGTFCVDPYSTTGCGEPIGATYDNWPVCAPYCGVCTDQSTKAWSR